MWHEQVLPLQIRVDLKVTAMKRWLYIPLSWCLKPDATLGQTQNTLLEELNFSKETTVREF